MPGMLDARTFTAGVFGLGRGRGAEAPVSTLLKTVGSQAWLSRMTDWVAPQQRLPMPLVESYVDGRGLEQYRRCFGFWQEQNGRGQWRNLHDSSGVFHPCAWSIPPHVGFTASVRQGTLTRRLDECRFTAGGFGLARGHGAIALVSASSKTMSTQWGFLG
ncbi:hypothetical protein MTO96_016134 [Rhipicephalus appendiculatus]